MKRRILCLVLAWSVILSLAPAVPARAEAETAYIPFTWRVLNAEEESIVLVSGLYRDNQFYANLQEACGLLAGEVTSSSPNAASFTTHHGMRAFQATARDGRVYEKGIIGATWEYDTGIPALFHQEQCYISLLQLILYCGGTYDLSGAASINLVYRMPYTLYDLMPDLQSLGADAYFQFEQLGKSEHELLSMLNVATDVAILSQGNPLEKIFAQDALHEAYVEEVLLEILETEGSQEELPRPYRVDQTICEMVGYTRLLVLAKEGTYDADVVREVSDAADFAKDVGGVLQYGQAALGILQTVERYRRLDLLQRTLLQKTLLDHASLCPSLQKDHQAIHTVADRLSFKLSGTREATIMEVAEYALDTLTDTLLAGFTPGNILSDIPDFDPFSLPLPQTLLLEPGNRDADKIMMEASSALFKETKSSLFDLSGVDQFVKDEQLIYKAFIASTITRLANQQMAAHYQRVGTNEFVRECGPITEDLYYALILQLKASIAARQYLLDSQTGHLSSSDRSRLNQANVWTSNLLHNLEHLTILGPGWCAVAYDDDLTWMQDFWDVSAGNWAVDRDRTSKTALQALSGVLDADHAVLSFEHPFHSEMSLLPGRDVSRFYTHVGRYLLLEENPVDMILYLDDRSYAETRLVTTLHGERVVWVKAARPTSGVCLTSGQLSNSYGVISTVVTEPCFDFDGDGRKDSLFLDQYTDTSYYWVQAIPADAGIEDGTEAWDYQQTLPYLLPYQQYFGDGYVADYTNPAWPDPEAVNSFWLELSTLSFLRAGDGLLYAAEASCIGGAAGWPEMYVTLYRQTPGSMQLERCEIDLSAYLMKGYDSYFLEPMINDFRCEYVADLGQWCFVLSQAGEKPDGVYTLLGRTCLTLRNGQVEMLAQYLGDRRVE